ncbi:MAG: hypothetical protein ABIQ11_06470 [Saprospiraceae bacterium]
MIKSFFWFTEKTWKQKPEAMPKNTGLAEGDYISVGRLAAKNLLGDEQTTPMKRDHRPGGITFGGAHLIPAIQIANKTGNCRTSPE